MNEISTQGNALKALRILYFAMLGGTIMLAIIIYFTSADLEPAFADHGSNALVIALFAATICVSVSSYMWRKDLGKLQNLDTLETRFNAYRAAAIKRYAFTEFAILFSVICYFFTKEPKLYIVVLILIAHFITMFPTGSKVAAQMGESREAIEAL